MRQEEWYAGPGGGLGSDHARVKNTHVKSGKDCSASEHIHEACYAALVAPLPLPASSLQRNAGQAEVTEACKACPMCVDSDVQLVQHVVRECRGGGEGYVYSAYIRVPCTGALAVWTVHSVSAGPLSRV